jgi:hypothetical protein
MQQIGDGRPEAGATSWLFREMTTLRPHRTARVSSWDRSGRNRDFIMLPPHATMPLAELDGPGCVQYLYAALLTNEHEPLRSLVLRMYWDGETEPSVEAPFGDFFGVVGGTVRYFSSLLLAVNPGGFGPGRCDGFNCYFPMPFARGAHRDRERDRHARRPALVPHQLRALHRARPVDRPLSRPVAAREPDHRRAAAAGAVAGRQPQRRAELRAAGGGGAGQPRRHRPARR